MIKIQSCNIHHEQRVIFISDVHGDLDLLKKLLQKVEYQREDVLFINGDLCEKGPHSLGVVRYVMELQKRSLNVYVTQGNCDILIRHVLEGNERVLDYMDQQPNSILHDMLEEHGKTHTQFSSLQQLAKFYQTHFSDEINWLINLPTVYETEEFIIVHAGIDNTGDWKTTSLTNALTTSAFYEQGHQAEKTVVVGHWPVSNYCSMLPNSNNPIIDFDKKMICLDGANRVKFEGQINVLILENGSFSHTYVDRFADTRKVHKSYDGEENFVGAVTYPNYELNPLKRGEFFTLCKNVNLGIKQWVKNEYLDVREDGLFCKGDVSTTKLSVSTEEEIAIVDDQCEGYVLVKQGGSVGWIPKQCIMSNASK